MIIQVRYSMPRLGSSLELDGGLLEVRSSLIRKSFLLDQVVVLPIAGQHARIVEN